MYVLYIISRFANHKCVAAAEPALQEDNPRLDTQRDKESALSHAQS